MVIYELVFGTDSGQVNCCFHNDSVASAGIGPNGEYHCFACGAAAHDEKGFIAKYFSVGFERAEKIKQSLENLRGYTYVQNPLEQSQIDFLHSIGLKDDVIQKYFFRAGGGSKLMYKHIWNGINVGYTWFNSPMLYNHNAGFPKYKYDRNNIGGSLSPYDDVIRYDKLIICEGEKDMLTAKSVGFPNAVAKIGGAKTYLIGGVNLLNKGVVIVYDCDDAGREGAIRDANYLVERFGCRVKVIDLALGPKEDLNDYFIKYGKTMADFQTLVKNTPLFVVTPVSTQSKVEQFVDSLSADGFTELVKLVDERRKGETK